ncbi:L,D-transpeptidase family protein [Mumia sp. ZJ1417]|uniref:L,D-transpeptidase family protein n=1 Tax=unclassified Mumia TaxID=2621872 RepID=UPI0014238493|nr:MULTISPECIES: L,D-transpeptidase family protein [unclassified Mumia]QMW66282.1 L,D-transpeptidase family protein [Mumia sp. ZJ1417]
MTPRAVTLVAVTALFAAVPATTAAASTARAADTVRLDGVTVHLRAGTTQVVTVNRTRSYRARVTYWVRRDSQWVAKRRSTNGRIGYGGLVAASKRKQSTGTTPLGTFTMTEAFGLRAKPTGSRLPYRKVRRGDYWVQDNRSAYYNTLRNKASGGFRWWLPASHRNASERLRDYRKQYVWSVVVDFNRPPRAVRYRGSGIFLHANGKGATAGCVSAPSRFIRYVLKRLRPDRQPVIAIGR